MIAVLLMFAQIVPAPAEPNPVATTIAAIRANPKKFDGQVVRLHGWVTSCRPLSCLIHERPSSAPGGPGADLSIGGDKKFDDTVRPLLPTYVELDARFDASCMSPRRSGNMIIICTDRVPELTVVTLRSVVSPEPPEIEK